MGRPRRGGTRKQRTPTSSASGATTWCSSGAAQLSDFPFVPGGSLRRPQDEGLGQASTLVPTLSPSGEAGLIIIRTPAKNARGWQAPSARAASAERAGVGVSDGDAYARVGRHRQSQRVVVDQATMATQLGSRRTRFRSSALQDSGAQLSGQNTSPVHGSPRLRVRSHSQLHRAGAIGREGPSSPAHAGGVPPSVRGGPVLSPAGGGSRARRADACPTEHPAEPPDAVVERAHEPAVRTISSLDSVAGPPATSRASFAATWGSCCAPR